MRRKKINPDEELDNLIKEFEEQVKNWKAQPKPKQKFEEYDEYEQDTWEEWE